MFNQIATRYDVINHILSLGIDNTWRKKAATILSASNPAKILDIACGTADQSLAVLRKIPAAKITGIDISEEMLQIGLKKVTRRGHAENIHLESGDAEFLEFQDDTFDAITISFGIRNVQDREKALREMNRVLKPGGILVILEFSLPQNRILRKGYGFYFNNILPLLGGIISGDFPAYRYFVRSVKQFPHPQEFGRILENAGFSVETSVPLSGGIAWIYGARK